MEVRSDLESGSRIWTEADIRTTSMRALAPRAPNPAIQVNPSGTVILPWVLAGVATLVALIAVYFAVTRSRRAH